MKRFGLNLQGVQSPLETGEISKVAEEEGFDYIWVADENPASKYRDVSVNMTTIALKTDKIKIGTGVCNPYSRHPALLAVLASTLEELAGGRVALGLGAGGELPLKSLGIEMWEKPLTTVKESIEVIREILSGEVVNYDGEMIEVNDVNLSFFPERKVPIYLAARGPKFTRMIGEIADGSLLNSPLHYIESSIDKIEEGAEGEGRRIKDLDVGNILPLAISEDPEKARAKVEYMTTFMAAATPNFVHEDFGTEIERIEKIRNALEEGEDERAIRLMTTDIIDQFSITGTQEDCLEKIEKLFKAGITQIIFSLPDSKENVKSVGEKIIPYFEE